MLGKSSTVEAKKKMLQNLKAARVNSEQAKQEQYEQSLKEMRAKLRAQEEAERLERERVERENSLEAQRQRERVKLDQEERRKKEAEERRSRVLAFQEEEEEKLRKEREELQRQVEQRRADNVQKFETMRSTRPAELSRSIRFGQFVSGRSTPRDSPMTTARQLNTLRPTPPTTAPIEEEEPAVPTDPLALTGEIEQTLKGLKH